MRQRSYAQRHCLSESVAGDPTHRVVVQPSMLSERALEPATSNLSLNSWVPNHDGVVFLSYITEIHISFFALWASLVALRNFSGILSLSWKMVGMAPARSAVLYYIDVWPNTRACPFINKSLGRIRFMRAWAF